MPGSFTQFSHFPVLNTLVAFSKCLLFAILLAEDQERRGSYTLDLMVSERFKGFFCKVKLLPKYLTVHLFLKEDF